MYPLASLQSAAFKLSPYCAPSHLTVNAFLMVIFPEVIVRLEEEERVETPDIEVGLISILSILVRKNVNMA